MKDINRDWTIGCYWQPRKKQRQTCEIASARELLITFFSLSVALLRMYTLPNVESFFQNLKKHVKQ